MVATHPLGCKQQVTVAVVCLTKDNCERKGEKTDRWLLGYLKHVKYNPSLSYGIVFCLEKQVFCLGKQGFCVGSLRRDKGCQAFLCCVRLGSSWVTNIPQWISPTEQRQMIHEAYTLTARLVLGISHCMFHGEVEKASNPLAFSPLSFPSSAITGNLYG